MATATKKPAAKKPAAKAEPTPEPAVDATYPAQTVDITVDPETGNAHVKVDGVFDREAARALAKTVARTAAEVS